jgi:hypothetical protein
MRVRIEIYNVGQAFGTVGRVVRVSDGETLYTTPTLPYDFRAVARERCENHIASRGWREDNAEENTTGERA